MYVGLNNPIDEQQNQRAGMYDMTRDEFAITFFALRNYQDTMIKDIAKRLETDTSDSRTQEDLEFLGGQLRDVSVVLQNVIVCLKNNDENLAKWADVL